MNYLIVIFCIVFCSQSLCGVLEDQAHAQLNLILAEKSVKHTVTYESTKNDSRGVTHIKFQQIYKTSGLPIWGGYATVHFKGTTFEVTDNLVNVTTNITTSPLIPKINAILMVIKNFLLNTNIELIVLPGSAEGSGSLQWKIGYADSTVSKIYYLVNATGRNYREFYHDRRSSNGPSQYNGVVNFTTTPFLATEYMEDKNRSYGVFDCSSGSCVRIANNGSYWNATDQKSAVSVMWGAAVSLDYFEYVHGRNGIDGMWGPAIANSVDSLTPNLFPHNIHYGVNVTEALYTDTGIYYGDGDGVNFGPMVSLDIVGHEVAHGIISLTAGLVYLDESGALVESFSDVFAAMIERYAYGETNNTWTIGEDVFTPFIAGDAIRSLKDPRASTNQHSDPDHYSLKYNGTDDNGGVHTNAGIPNKAFYLCSEGGNNSYGGPIMTGIGADACAFIWFRAVTQYMTASTDFAGAQLACIRAARDLYGVNMTQYFAVQTSWALVGVGEFPNIPQASLITNGALEISQIPWTLDGTPGGVAYIARGLSPHGGKGYVVLGGANSVQSTVSQLVTNITSTAASANLTFWLWTTSVDNSTTGDRLYVELHDAITDASIVILDTFTNLQNTTSYVRKGPYDIGPYRAQPLKLVFRVVTDGNLPTTWKLDDVSLTQLVF